MYNVLRQRFVLLGLAVAAVLASHAGASLAAAALVGAVFGAAACLADLPHEAPPPPAPDPGPAARVAALEDTIARLRHDLNGILSPALLTADRLLTHTDPAVRRTGEVIAHTVERAAARLAETKAK